MTRSSSTNPGPSPRKEHPDVSKLPDAKQRWQELSAAYDVLNDPAARSGAGVQDMGGSIVMEVPPNGWFLS